MHLKNDIMMVEVFIIYAPVPFSVQCSPTVFVLSTRDLAVILAFIVKRFFVNP